MPRWRCRIPSLPKLQQQPFGLRRLAGAIEAALRNFDRQVPIGPAGLDLSDPPLLMGVLNVTPDSFSDGGSYAGTDEAVRLSKLRMPLPAAAPALSQPQRSP